jgi:ribosomal protein S18 acetylase RimI-like enzyme
VVVVGSPSEPFVTGIIRFRRPAEADYLRMVRVVDDWWAGRHIDTLLPRLWLQHFTGTSWLVEDESGRLAGFLVGFVSPDEPTTAYCHMVAIDPNRRGRGIGRQLYERFFHDARAAGATRVVAVTWPGNRASVAFHRALGFQPATGPGTQNLYGTPAYPGYDFDREDRVVLTRPL